MKFKKVMCWCGVVEILVKCFGIDVWFLILIIVDMCDIFLYSSCMVVKEYKVYIWWYYYVFLVGGNYQIDVYGVYFKMVVVQGCNVIYV